MTGSAPLDDLAPVVERWRTAVVRAARARATAVQAEKEIMAALGDADVGTVAGEPVVRRDVQDRPSFAFAAFKAEHPELVSRFVYCQRRQKLKLPSPHDRAKGDT